MIGIDLVDLSDPLLRKRDAHALRLITHPDDAFPHGNHSFWYLWAAKESVFKAQRQLVRYDPKSIPIVFDTHLPDTFASGSFQGKILHFDQLILAIAAENPDRVEFEYYLRKTANASVEIRDLISAYMRDRYQLVSNVEQDHLGLPVLQPLRLPVSIAHHAGYLAFAIPLTSDHSPEPSRPPAAG